MAKKASQRQKQTFLKKNMDVQPEKFSRYSPKEEYRLGDLIDHPTFGQGYIEEVLPDNKIAVIFEGGGKILIHAR